MNIDRHNYEEFFLLYIDNELTAVERKQVELFVEKHPDLEEELMLLRQLKLTPDDGLTFPARESLIRDGRLVHDGNYRDYILLSIDNELNPEQTLALDEFLAGNPDANEEFVLLKQTKLEPEVIEFPGKESLYRRERPVVAIWWRRVAVAAVLILGLTFGYFQLSPDGSTNMNNGEGTLVTVTRKENILKENIKGVEQPEVTSTSETNPKPGSENNEQPKTENPKSKTQNTTASNNLPVPPDDNRLVVNNIEKENLDETLRPEVITAQVTTRDLSPVVSAEKPLIKHALNIVDVTKDNAQTPDKSDQVIYASNPESKTLRGLFRKATRFIERTTRINPADDDERVLIGGVAINLK